MKKGKYIVWTMLFLPLFYGCGLFAKTATQGNLPPLVEKIQPAVVTIVTYDSEGKVSDLGSGFFVDNQGHLITNYHVLKGAYAADIKTYDGRKYPIEWIVAENETADLIKVRVGLDEMPVYWVAVAQDEPSIGERVLVVGSPLGLEQTVSEGIVSAIRDLPAVGKIFQLSAPISPGSSGGPVVNMKGAVVGVVSFQALAGQNLNFAVSSQGILNLTRKGPAKSLSEWTYDINKRTPQLAEALCRKGFKFSIQGEFKKALNYYQDAVERNPGDVVAWNGLGSCYDGLDRPEEAIAAFQQAIQADPENAGAYFTLAQYYRKLGRFEEAIQSYKLATEADPDHAPSFFDLGTIYNKLEDFESGEKAFRQVLRIIPDHVPSYYYLGQGYILRERYGAAIESYQKALALNPDSASLYYNLGIAYGGLGKGEEAFEAFKQAIRIDPDYAPAHYNIGLKYIRNGDKAAALSEYKILKGLETNMAEMLFRQIYQ